jgi:hypothetical protein
MRENGSDQVKVAAARELLDRAHGKPKTETPGGGPTYEELIRRSYRPEPSLLQAFPHHRRLAMKACKGPGKTAVEAWLAWNFLATREHPKVAAISVSGDNLSDNL